MNANAVYKSLKQDMTESPFVMRRESVHGYYTESRDAEFKFVKRGEKYYVQVKLGTWPSEHENEHAKFRSWLVEMTAKYGWKPHLTSGGVGNYTYRLNSDLNLDWY